MVVSKVNIYQLTEGKKQTIYIQPLFKNFCRILSSFISVPFVITACHTLELVECVCCIELYAQNKKQSHENISFSPCCFQLSPPHSFPNLKHTAGHNLGLCPATKPASPSCFCFIFLPSQVSGSEHSFCHLTLAHSMPCFSSQGLG